METGIRKKIEKYLNEVFKLFREYSNIDRMIFFLNDRENNFYCWTVNPTGIKNNFCSTETDHLIIQSIIKKEMSLVEDVTTDKQTIEMEQKMWGNDAKTVLCFPLVTEKEVPFAMVELIKTRPEEKFLGTDFEYAKIVSEIMSTDLRSLFDYRELKTVFLQIVRALTGGIDAKDPYCQGHSERVCKYSLMIAKELELDEEKTELVELSALLHDIGKLGVSEEILHKQSKLSDEEWAEIKKHPTIGAAMISSIKQLKEVIPAVRYHQERYDGQGYPEGLWGDSIPLASRIIAVADTFDAMTSDRPYRKRFPEEIALGELNIYSGIQFDPRCVESFLRAYEKLKSEETK